MRLSCFGSCSFKLSPVSVNFLHYSILSGEFQWEQKKKAAGFDAWEQKRLRVLPAYSILSGKKQGENSIFSFCFSPGELSEMPAGAAPLSGVFQWAGGKNHFCMRNAKDPGHMFPDPSFKVLP